MKPQPPPEFGDVFELRVSLRHISPVIWRRIRIPADATLGLLHEAIQATFGWRNSHLHEFAIGDIRFGMVQVEDETFCVNENAAPLGAIIRQGSMFLYRYDFGDGWEHDVVVERTIRGGDASLTCLSGARACPPEDCGGPPGYAHLLEVLTDPKNEEYPDMKTWVGRGFDPEKFEQARVNKKLAPLSRRFASQRR